MFAQDFNWQERETCKLYVEWKLNVMAHAQKPDLVFQRKGRVHLYWRGCQFSRLLAAEVCASAVVMLDRPCSHTVHECWLPTPFASFPFTSLPVLRRVPSHSVSTLPAFRESAKCRYVCTTVRPSDSRRTDFREILRMSIFRTSVDKIPVSLKSDKNNG